MKKESNSTADPTESPFAEILANLPENTREYSATPEHIRLRMCAESIRSLAGAIADCIAEQDLRQRNYNFVNKDVSELLKHAAFAEYTADMAAWQARHGNAVCERARQIKMRSEDSGAVVPLKLTEVLDDRPLRMHNEHEGARERRIGRMQAEASDLPRGCPSLPTVDEYRAFDELLGDFIRARA